MTHKPEFEAISIVAVGTFNPAIFQPLWLKEQGLIRPEEAEHAKVKIITADVSDFRTEWFHLQVFQNRLQMFSTDPMHYEPTRDLVASMFELLSHTPITLLGLNRSFHFKMRSVEAWHAIGHLLVPKTTWEPLLEEPGMLSVRLEGKFDEVSQSIKRLTVEPSSKVKPGVFVDINYEFRSPKGESEVPDATWVQRMITERWADFIGYSETVADHILNKAQ